MADTTIKEPSQLVSVRPRRFPAFDGLRAIAALSVLLLHTSAQANFTVRSSLGAFTSRLDVGVSIFFVISGFLLYRPFAVSHLAGAPRPDTVRFFERRLLRIVPAYWLALTVLAYGLGWISLGPGWQGPVIHYLFLQIYLPHEIFNGITQAWSLCTEMSFYLFLPLYGAAISYRRRSQASQMLREMYGLIAMVAVSILFRWWALNVNELVDRHGHVVSECSPHCNTVPAYISMLPDWLPANLDLFALGMFLALMSAWFVERRSEPSWLKTWWMPWLSWALAGGAFLAVSELLTSRKILFYATPVAHVERQALYGLVAFFLVAPAVFGPQDRSAIRKFLMTWPMASIGVISYGIYIWHVNLMFKIFSWIGIHGISVRIWNLTPAVLVASIAVAAASYFILEKPMLRLKGRLGWWTRPPAQATEAPEATGSMKDVREL